MNAIKNPLFIFSLPLLLGLLSSCSTLKKSEDPLSFTEAPLFGMACDAEGEPVKALTITVDGVQQTQSDINGRFVIPSLTRGTHTLETSASGYEPLSLSVPFLNRSQVLYLTLYSEENLIALAEQALDGGKLEEAREAAARALSLETPENPAVVYLAAIIALRLDENERARELLRKLVAAGYDTEEVKALLERVEER